MTHLLFAALYVLLGWAACVRWRLPARGLEGFAWAYGLGTGLASLGVMSLVAVGAWGPFADAPHLAAIVFIVASILVGWPYRRSWSRRPLPTPRRTPSRREFLGPLLLLPTFYFALRWSRVDSGFDALAYHLPAVARLATDGLGRTIGLLDGEMRLGFDLLFLPGFDLADRTSSGPATIHAVATLALASGVAAEAARRTSFAVGVAFGALFLVTPGVASIARHAYVDVGVGLYVFLALAAAARALSDGDRASVLAAGLFAGFAANAKLPAGAAIGAVAIALLFGRKGMPAQRAGAGAKAAGLSAAIAVLAALPWFVRAYVNTGNPFFPALLDRYGSGWADAGVVAATKQGVLDQLPIPRDALYGLRAIVHGAFSSKGGFEAPAWVIAFAPAALLRPKTPALRGLLAGSAVLLVAWVAFVPLFRFGIGLWAWGAVAAAFGAARLARIGRPVAIALVVLVAGLLGVGVLGLATAPRAPIGRVELERRFGPAIGFLSYPNRHVPGPVGLSSSLVAFAPPGTIALEPARNGLIRADAFDDPDRLLAACRRAGLRSLILDETTVEGRKAIACARVWANLEGFRVNLGDEDRKPSERVVTVTFPAEASK